MLSVLSTSADNQHQHPEKRQWTKETGISKSRHPRNLLTESTFQQENKTLIQLTNPGRIPGILTPSPPNKNFPKRKTTFDLLLLNSPNKKNKQIYPTKKCLVESINSPNKTSLSSSFEFKKRSLRSNECHLAHGTLSTSKCLVSSWSALVWICRGHWLNYLYFGGIKQCKYMVIWMEILL